MSASIKTFCHPRSRLFSFQRGCRIFRGPRDLHRRPPTEELSSMKSILTAHDSPSSSIVYQYSRHAMNHVWNLTIPPSTSDFKLQYPTLASGSDDNEFTTYPLISISCREPDWQLSSVAQVCNSSLPLLSTVEDPYIVHRYSQLVWKNDANREHPMVGTLTSFYCSDESPPIRGICARYRGRPARARGGAE
jgi:hypothetical protein